MKVGAARESIEMGAACAIVGLTIGVFLVGGDLHDEHNFLVLLKKLRAMVHSRPFNISHLATNKEVT